MAKGTKTQRLCGCMTEEGEHGLGEQLTEELWL